jgi:hypothetical protein
MVHTTAWEICLTPVQDQGFLLGARLLETRRVSRFSLQNDKDIKMLVLWAQTDDSRYAGELLDIGQHPIASSAIG